MSWIVARTEPQREQAARRFLQLRGFSVYLPYIHERHTRSGRRIARLRPLFPSYAFVALQNGRWWDARWCVGVAAVIMSGSEPARLSNRIVDEIRARERNGLVVLPERSTLKPGDQVRVLAGPFNGSLALYAGQRSHERVLVLLALLGGEQKVELPRHAIEMVE